MKALLSSLLFTLALTAQAAVIDSKIPLNKSLKADLMTLQASKQLQTISQKMKEALSQNQTWLQAYIKKHQKTQGALPYNSKMGISKEEYQYLINNQNHAMRLHKKASIKLRFESKGDTIVIHSEPKTPLDGAVLTESKAKTMLGTLDQTSSINQTDPNSLTGAWTGKQWKLEQIDVAKQKMNQVKIAIGTLSESDEGIVYFNLKYINPAKNKRIEQFAVFYFPIS